MKSYYVYLLILLFSCSKGLADGRITQAEFFQNEIQLSIKTTPGTNYLVQSRTLLTEGEWQDAGAEFEATSTISLRSFALNQETGYFRVIVLNPLDKPPPPSLPPPIPPSPASVIDDPSPPPPPSAPPTQPTAPLE